MRYGNQEQYPIPASNGQKTTEPPRLRSPLMITILDHQLEQSQDHGDDQQTPSSSKPCRCCLLLPHSCRLPDSSLPSVLEHKNIIQPFRFVLTGPQKSGRSSLLFHLACSVAAQDSRTTVVYIRALDAADDDGSCWLPLEGCCLAELQDTMEEPLLRGSQSISLQPMQSKSPLSSLSSTYLNEPSILTRIQMHHVVCIRDVYELLFSGAVLASPRGRTSLIVLDDLDRLCPNGTQQQDLHMAMSQLLSVLVDTANHGSPTGPISVAVSMTANHTSGRLQGIPVFPTLSLETIQISAPVNDGAYKQIMNKATGLLHQRMPDMLVTGSWCVERAKSRQYYAILKDGMDPDCAGKRVLMHLGDA